MATHYGSIDGVLIRSGIGPEDLGFIDDPDEVEEEDSGSSDAFGDFIIELLTEATDLMDRVMRRSYLTAARIPAGLNGIANDAVAESIRVMVQSRQSPVVRIDDFAVSTISARLLTPEVMRRLRYYARGAVSVDIATDLMAEEAEAVTLDDLDES